jgi:hypothetical protein
MKTPTLKINPMKSTAKQFIHNELEHYSLSILIISVSMVLVRPKWDEQVILVPGGTS